MTTHLTIQDSKTKCEVDFGSKEIEKLNSDITESVKSHFLHLINGLRCKLGNLQKYINFTKTQLYLWVLVNN